VTPTLVLALGNPLRGDDGVGQAVLCALEQRALGPGVELVDGGTPGLNTVLLLEGRSRVIVIDAADFGACPGNVRRFELTANDLSLQPVHSNSLHAAGLLEALALATALGVLPAQVALYGVQPRRFVQRYLRWST
jgi:hydrogenase maturation protease